MQNIASQILSETPSSTPAPVNATESSEQQPVESTEQKPQGADDFDARFGVLAKMERKIKEQEASFKNRSKEWEEKERRLSEHEEFIKLFEENPLEALKKKKGWGVQEFNEFAVKHSEDDDLDPVSKMTKDFQTQLDEMRSKLTEEFESKIKAKEEEIQGKDHERQIVEFKSGIKSFLAENKDDFEFINAEENGADSVYELIYEDILRQKQADIPDDQLKVMDVKDAAERVETFLDKQYSKYLSLNKVKSKFTSSDSPDMSRFMQQSASPSTLNSSFSPKSKPTDQLSLEERKRAAAEMVRSWKN